MTDSSDQHENSGLRFDEVLAAYLRRIDQGEEIDKEKFIVAHPEVAESLREYFQTAERVERLVEPPIEKTIDSHPPSKPLSSPTKAIRYFGDYVLLEEIARGGMGVVYKARQVKLNRIVAVKMILAGQLATEQDVKRFHSEAEAAANLQHPNIVPIYEIGEHEGQHYFSMGIVDGRSLAYHAGAELLDPSQAATIVEQVSRAVQYAHERGVIHRDLKPSNILIDTEGQPHVTDFGLAKRVESDSDLTRTGQVLGTPSFMPPEQAAGRLDIIGPATDVYSLGAILYTLLTGRPPFQSATVMDTLKQVVEREAISPRQLNPAISRDLETISLKCLEKSVARRYSTSAAFADELARFQRGEPIQARPITRAARAWKWCRRNPTVAALSAACCLAVVAGMIGVTTQWFRAEVEADRANQEAGRANREAAAARASERQVRTENLIACKRLYAAQMKRAEDAWRDGNLGHARSILLQQETDDPGKDLRGFDWHYLWRLCHRELMTLEAADFPVNVAFSPDGERLISAGRDNTVTVWDVRRGEVLKRLTGHKLTIHSIAVSPDGQLIASIAKVASAPEGRGSPEIMIWDAATGDRLAEIVGQSRNIGDRERSDRSLAFSPDSQYLAVADATTVSIWKSRTGEPVLVYDGHSTLPSEAGPQSPRSSSAPDISSVAFSPDGIHIASAAHARVNDLQRIHIWEYQTGELVTEVTSSSQFYSRYVRSLVFGRSKNLLVAGHGDGVTLWGLPSATPMPTYQQRKSSGLGSISSVAVHPYRPLIAIASNDENHVLIWDYTRHSIWSELRGHGQPVHSVAFSPNGWRLASSGQDGKIKLWDLRRNEPYRATRRFDTGQFVGFLSGDDRFLALNNRGFKSLRESFENPQKMNLGVWDSISGELLFTLENSQGTHPRAGVCRAAISEDGELVAGCKLDGSLSVWHADSGRLVRSLHTELQDSRSGSGILTFGRENKLLAYGVRSTVELWDWEANQKIRTLEHDQIIKDLACSPTGKYLATAGVTPGVGGAVINVWDVDSGQLQYQLAGHTDYLNAIRFSVDGKWLASASDDRRVRIWEASSGREVRTLLGHRDGVTGLAFSPTGDRLLTFSGGDVKHWITGVWQETLSCNFGTQSSEIFPKSSRLTFSHSGECVAVHFSSGVSILDAQPLTEAVADERAASRLAEYLVEDGLLEKDALELLSKDTTIPASVRDGAVNLYRYEPGSRSSESFATTGLVFQSGLRSDEYERAFRAIERRAPAYVLGVAQYRVARYEESLRTLEEAVNRMSSESANYLLASIFKAMALHQLGRRGEAREALNQIEQRAATVMPDQNVRLWLCLLEAQSLIRETNVDPKLLLSCIVL